jgi:hypothetical protein
MAAERTAIEANTAIHMWEREGERCIKASLSEHLYECSSCLKSNVAAERAAYGTRMNAPMVACSAASGAKAKPSVIGAAAVSIQSAGFFFVATEKKVSWYKLRGRQATGPCRCADL